MNTTVALLAVTRRMIAATCCTRVSGSRSWEHKRSEAWAAARALLGEGYRWGRLEALVNDHADRRVARVLEGFRRTSVPSNDLHHAEAVAQ